MYCAKCQQPLVGGSHICISCGYDNTLGALPKTATATEPSAPQQATPATPPGHAHRRPVPHFTAEEISPYSSGKNWGGKAIGALIVLTALGLALYGGWQYRQNWLARHITWVTPPIGTQITSAAGLDFTCTTVEGGQVMCWGNNELGQLGDTALVRPGRPATVRQAGFSFGAIDAGDRHVCGITTTGAVMCWGSNMALQLGTRQSDECRVGGRPVRCAVAPMAAPVTGGAMAISVGVDHSCALSGDSSVTCWGNNARGQLGVPNLPAESLVAHPGARLRFASISAGGYHNCGLLGNGAALCWGWDVFGQLGAPGRPDMCGPTNAAKTPCRMQPVGAAPRLRFSQIAAGREHTCGIARDGKIFCWGANQHGELGMGRIGGSTLDPQEVLGGRQYRALGAGEGYNCAIANDNSVWCWGSAAFRQLGTGDSTTQATPVQVPVGEPVRAITVGQRHACVLTEARKVFCWGDWQSGQAGHVMVEGKPNWFEAGPPSTGR